MNTCRCLCELKGWFILYSRLINHKSIKQKILKVSLEKQISKYSDLTNKEYLIIKSYFKNKMLKKGEILHSTNTICDKYYFIETGLIRYFIINNGEEITGGFFFEGEGYTDLNSFITNSYSRQTAQVIECSSLLFISRADLEKLYKEVPKFERVGRILAEQALLNIRNKIDNHMLLDAKKRYLNLIECRPSIIRRVPQHYIASYLGIKPQSLSRIRKNLLF